MDYEKLGAAGGWTTGSATVIFGKLRRKIQKGFDEGRLASQKSYRPTDPVISTPSKKRGRPKKDITPSSADDLVIDTPSKKRPRKIAPKSSRLVTVEDDDLVSSPPMDLDDSDLMADAEEKEAKKQSESYD